MYHQGNPHQQGPMGHQIPHVVHQGGPVIQYSMATGGNFIYNLDHIFLSYTMQLMRNGFLKEVVVGKNQ